jgi:hypothetical protein
MKCILNRPNTFRARPHRPLKCAHNHNNVSFPIPNEHNAELKYIVVEKKIVVQDEQTSTDLKDVKSRVTVINILLNGIIEDIDTLKRQMNNNLPDGMT